MKENINKARGNPSSSLFPPHHTQKSLSAKPLINSLVAICKELPTNIQDPLGFHQWQLWRALSTLLEGTKLFPLPEKICQDHRMATDDPGRDLKDDLVPAPVHGTPPTRAGCSLGIPPTQDQWKSPDISTRKAHCGSRLCYGWKCWKIRGSLQRKSQKYKLLSITFSK